MGRFIFVSFGLLVVFLSLSGTGADCPSGWSSYEGHCYKPFNEPKNWADAERFCKLQPKHSHLVSFQSAEEADFVVKLTRPRLKANLVWMGLSNIWHERNLKWTNGASVSYDNLYEPYIRKCFVVQPWEGKSKWYKADCEEKNAFLCKFPKPH